MGDNIRDVIEMSMKEIEFEFERATKNTYRFQENASKECSIGTVYVKKSVFGTSELKRAKVTMEWE